MMERVVALSQDSDVRVSVTNSLRSMEDRDNIRYGTMADTVLNVHLGQYHTEYAFGLEKSGLGMSACTFTDCRGRMSLPVS